MIDNRRSRQAGSRQVGLYDLVRDRATTNPDALAFIAPGHSPLNYAGLLCQVDEVVNALRMRGIRSNDRVAMACPSGPLASVASVSVACGATLVPLNPGYGTVEVESRFANLGCTALLVPEGCISPATSAARSRGIPVIELSATQGGAAGIFTLRGSAVVERRIAPAPTVPQNNALALFTSGSTARPRLVPLSHKNLCAAATSIRDVLGLSESDRCLAIMPMFHIHGLSAIFASLASGASIVCMGEFSVDRFFRCLSLFHPTWYTAAPALHRTILDNAARYPEIVAASSLRFLRSASAAMPPRLRADLERLFEVPLIEAFGMTEAAPQITSNRMPPAPRKAGSVGRAAGPEVAILDSDGRFAPIGRTGEIVIRGPNVFEGYADGDNDDAFVDGWFRTSDQGYIDADGDLFVTGRLTDIINRGGEKISPREVEDVLLDHPAVAQAVVFPIPHPRLGEGVAAAVVRHSNCGVTEAELRRFTAARLAGFKAPQQVVLVASIPLGPGGKVQRSGLAQALGLSGSGPGEYPRCPHPSIEQRVSHIWADVLGVDNPRRDDDFFRCGGHSLDAIQIQARLQREFGIELGNDVLFTCPTIASLTGQVRQQLCQQKTRPPDADEVRSTPLSLNQEGLWFLDQLEPGNPAYIINAPLRLTGTLDEESLGQTLNELRRRHEALRATFMLSGDRPVQLIAPPESAPLEVTDLTALPANDLEALVLRLTVEESARPFDLAKGPLFRASLLRVGPADHVLLLSTHHIVSDGWSTGVLYRELRVLYAAYAHSSLPTLPEFSAGFAEIVERERERLNGRLLDTQLEYWKRQLADRPPPTDLPTDRPRPAVPGCRGARVARKIDSALVDRLKALSRLKGVTPFMALMAAFLALLARTTGQRDLLLGVPVANRARLETYDLIGYFANTLVFRGDLSGDPTFEELMFRVKVTAQNAFAHQDLPFGKLVQALHPLRDGGGSPLFRIMFAYQDVPYRTTEPFDLGSELTAVPLRVDSGAAKFDLTLYLWEQDGDMRLDWLYNADLFDARTIGCLADQYQVLLDGIVADPSRRVSGLPLLTTRERRRIVAKWSRTASYVPSAGSFVELLESQSRRMPSALAIESGDHRLTYGELNSRANQLARHLRKLGVTQEDRVGICLFRSADMITAILAVLKSGGACLPIDPKNPQKRISAVLSDARPRVVISETTLSAQLQWGERVALVNLDRDRDLLAAEDTCNPERKGTGDHLAYVIYTSGSTGKPKGVMITHANLFHGARAIGRRLGLNAADRYLHTASFGFSSSVRQFAAPLGCGAAVIIAGSGDVQDPRALLALIRDRRVTVIDIVPSFWRACLLDVQELEGAQRAVLLDNVVRLIASASERLAPDLPGRWQSESNRPVRTLNMYGQTETTGIVCTCDVVSGRETDAVPIGRPLENTRIYVLDRAGEPVPTGVTGELYVAGDGVGKGYLGQPELTAERFLTDPFCNGDRMYRTGDLARQQPDGTLQFLGRDDDQLKVRGFRIEPGEVEITLARHPALRECAVVARAVDGHSRLVAFIVTSGPGARPGLIDELRSTLKRELPAYMLPGAIIELDALPRGVNGKVDRLSLAARVADSAPAPLTKPDRPSADAIDTHSATELALAQIWRDLLHVEQVRSDDGFFDLGGDSLLSVQMIRRANQAGLKLTLKQLFEHQTVAELARAATTEPHSEDHRPPAKELALGPGSVGNAGEPMVLVTPASLRAYGLEALERAGLDPKGAAVVTEVQLEASLRGQPTHNMDSIPRYARRILAGSINPRPGIRIEQESRISARIDGDNGPGQWVATIAMETAIRKAREAGVGVVSVRHSNHFGAAGHYVWLAARRGLIGLCTTNGPVVLAPTGGLTPMFGNNPLGVGIPAGRYHPIVLDFAISVAPRSKIGLQLAEGKPLPSGWILDPQGRPSVDPADLIAGLGVPIGGHKGYGLALAMEALAGVLPGAGFCRDHSRRRMRDPEETNDLGHFFIAMDPGLFSTPQEFTARVDRLIEQTKSAERMEGVEEILIPGEAELRARELNVKHGAPLLPLTYRALEKYGHSVQLNTKLHVLL